MSIQIQVHVESAWHGTWESIWIAIKMCIISAFATSDTQSLNINYALWYHISTPQISYIIKGFVYYRLFVFGAHTIWFSSHVSFAGIYSSHYLPSLHPLINSYFHWSRWRRRCGPSLKRHFFNENSGTLIFCWMKLWWLSNPTYLMYICFTRPLIDPIIYTPRT